jgi:cell filamentation protein
LAAEHDLTDLTPEQFATRAAYYLGDLNAQHPFREGNGRTQRIFLSALAREAGYSLYWDRLDEERMVRASMLSLFRGDNTELERIVLDIMTNYP